MDDKFDASTVQEVQQRISKLRSKLQPPTPPPDPYVRAAVRKLDELERTLAAKRTKAFRRPPHPLEYGWQDLHPLVL